MPYLLPKDYTRFRRLWMLKQGSVPEMMKVTGKSRSTIYRIARKLGLPSRYQIIKELMSK